MTRNLLFTVFLLFIPIFLLAETTTFVCDYKTWSDQEGNHPVTSEFKLTFLIDGDSGKAYMIGNLGSEEVQVFVGDDSISFIEITDTKNIMTTAIASDGSSVHSRNSVMFDELIATQYYGACVSK